MKYFEVSGNLEDEFELDFPLFLNTVGAVRDIYILQSLGMS